MPHLSLSTFSPQADAGQFPSLGPAADEEIDELAERIARAEAAEARPQPCSLLWPAGGAASRACSCSVAPRPSA